MMRSKMSYITVSITPLSAVMRSRGLSPAIVSDVSFIRLTMLTRRQIKDGFGVTRERI